MNGLEERGMNIHVREIDDNTILMGKSMNENPIAQLFN